MATYGMLSASTINGTNVENEEGQNLGHIKDLMIDTTTGEIKYAVLSFGGFLGIGDKYFAVPFTSFEVDRVHEKFILNADKEFLQNSPGFDKDDWPADAGHSYYTSVSDYYGTRF